MTRSRGIKANGEEERFIGADMVMREMEENEEEREYVCNGAPLKDESQKRMTSGMRSDETGKL